MEPETTASEDERELDDSERRRVATPTRRGLFGVAGAVVVGGLGSSVVLYSGRARADVATGTLSIQGDSIVTDDGRLRSLTVSLSSGHVSYDGLDTEAATVDVNLFAAPSGGATDDAGNRIASKTATVTLESGLRAHAGHYDYSFTDVDVLAAADLGEGDFSAPTDGTTRETDVDFRVELLVKDSGGTLITRADATETVTISVTNQAQSSDTQGDGTVSAGGTNQSP